MPAEQRMRRILRIDWAVVLGTVGTEKAGSRPALENRLLFSGETAWIQGKIAGIL
jgi:hypothetical protein